MSKIETLADLERILADRVVRNAVLRRLNFLGLNVDFVVFHDVRFDEVGFACTSMRGASLLTCDIRGAMMRGVQLEQAHIEESNFAFCEAMEAVFRSADLINTRFDECQLGNTDFSAAELVNVIFEASDLYGARFSRSVMVHTRFENRRLGNAVLSKADFSSAMVLDASFVAADLGGASFRDSLLVRANFMDANLTGADFTNTLLIGVNLKGISADDQTRSSIKRALVPPGGERAAAMTYLTAAQDRLLHSVHALLTGYVLSAQHGQLQEVWLEKAPETAPPTVEPPAQQISPPEPVVSRESKEIYERFKKIELE